MSTRRGGFFTCVLFASVLASALMSGALRDERAAAQTPQPLPTIALTNPVGGFTSPVGITHAGDGSNRLFVVEQFGTIRLIKNGARVETPFLNISSRISTGSERGLLGLAFPPGYATKQYFYVFYTAANGDVTIARVRTSSNPDVADAASLQVILSIPHPIGNHNGGQLAFGPDGFLYAGVGDGGSAGDPPNNAQNMTVLLGKLLRLDTETGSPPTYVIPPSNPFAGRTDVRQEIWALGLRNPWRFSFDRAGGDLYIADVGQGSREEIDFQAAGSAGGQNYGWRIMEGTSCFNPNPCNSAGLTLPVWEYDHSRGDCSVTGGYVYRAARHPRMQGLYFYGDFCTGRIWALRRVGGVWENNLLFDATFQLSTFGEDEAGNLYVGAYNTGTIFTVTDTSPTPTPTPTPVPEGPFVQFAQSSLSMTEDCTFVNVTVSRTGPAAATQSTTVDYATADNTAAQKGDYIIARGTLRFAPGETSKTFALLINEDGFAEGAENFTVALNNVSGGTLAAPSTLGVQINDDETVNAATNPIDDAANFVCQQYHDFLNRQPDDAGQAFWTGQITTCGANAGCVDFRRSSVSNAFFLSIEFQETGFYVLRMQRAGLARRSNQPNQRVSYEQFVRDAQQVSAGVIIGQAGSDQRLEENKRAYALQMVTGDLFVARFPVTMQPDEYVNALFQSAGVNSPTPAEVQAARNAFGAGATEGRAAALRSVAESDSVKNAERSPAYVLMEYFGYLRRDPDDLGYSFWLQKLNEHGGDALRSEMVRSFLVSAEYRERFGR